MKRTLMMMMIMIYRAGEIDLFENLDIVHIRLLVGRHMLTYPALVVPLSQPT